MIQTFFNREKEIDFLENEFAENRKSFVVIYGRRRIGKTELIKKFISNKPYIYFLVSQEQTSIQLKRLTKKIADFFNERVPKIDDWIEFIDYTGEKLKKNKIIIVVDEFPYLIESNKAIPSYFQKLNDEYLNNSKSMLILSGSSIGMMESEVLGHKSPIYGRRTGQIDLPPFDFQKLGLMIKKEIKKRVIINAIFGNIPMYLSFFDNTISIKENIVKNILDKNSFLYKEPEFILKQELREPSKYMSILTSIAQGNTRGNDISNKTNIEPGTLSKYIGRLMELRLIERVTPITERNKKTKKSLYFIKDGLFDFWFNFIEPNLSDVEDNPKKFLEQTIIPNLSNFVSKTFENVCREFVRKKLNYGSVGRWWYKEKELDIVALNEQNREILFCECKWQDKVNVRKIVRDLKENAGHVKWNNGKRKEHYAVFAKSFSQKIKEPNLMLFDLKDLEKIFK